MNIFIYFVNYIKYTVKFGEITINFNIYIKIFYN
jgi:hypothetical protein